MRFVTVRDPEGWMIVCYKCAKTIAEVPLILFRTGYAERVIASHAKARHGIVDPYVSSWNAEAFVTERVDAN